MGAGGGGRGSRGGGVETPILHCSLYCSRYKRAELGAVKSVDADSVLVFVLLAVTGTRGGGGRTLILYWSLFCSTKRLGGGGGGRQ